MLRYLLSKSSKLNLNHKKIVLNRLDNIGDIIMTIPLAFWIKKQYPDCQIYLLIKQYTIELVNAIPIFDGYINWSEHDSKTEKDKIEVLKSHEIDVFVHNYIDKEIIQLVKKASIPYRVGNAKKIYMWTSCNLTSYFSYSKVQLNEAQLNIKLLTPIIPYEYKSCNELIKSIDAPLKVPSVELPEFINRVIHKPYVILHPFSNGHGKEWPLENYLKLAHLLLDKEYIVIFTGSEKEGLRFRQHLPKNANLFDTSGKLSLSQLIKLISMASALVASSTGPLHISGILGHKTIGLFANHRLTGPIRWTPLGNNTFTLISDYNCPICKISTDCDCIKNISPEKVAQLL